MKVILRMSDGIDDGEAGEDDDAVFDVDVDADVDDVDDDDGDA